MAAKRPKAVADMQLTAVRTLTTVLGAPTLQVSVSGSTATLSWTTPTPTGQSVLSGYRLYKAPAANGPFTLVTTTTATSVPDTLPGTQFYRVEAFDQYQTGNSSPPLSCSPITAGIKWAPGWGMVLDAGSGGGGLSGWLSQIAAIANEPNITWVLLRRTWANWEDAAGGTYTNGFSVFDQIVSACAAAGKKAAWAVAAEIYGSNPPTSASGTLPNYFESLVCSDGQSPGYVKWPGGTAWSGNLILCANLWDSVVMDRFIAMHAAYAARYENNPTVLMVHGPGETSHAVPVNMRGYTSATLTTQLLRWMTASVTQWPTTIRRLETNYLVTSDHVREQQLVTESNNLDIANGGPDIKSTTVTTNAMFTGSFAGSTDLRGINCFVSEIQTPDFNPYISTTAMQALWNIGESGSLSVGGSTQAQYYCVIRNNWDGSPNEDYPLWDANILPFIRSHPVPHLSYPTGWPAVAATPTAFTLSVQGTNRTGLSWSAVSGATTYKVYRNGALLASPTGTSYTDTTATGTEVPALDSPATAYAYTVSAVAGAESAQSSPPTIWMYRGTTGGSTCSNQHYSYGLAALDWADTTGSPVGGGVCVRCQFNNGTGGGWQPFTNPPLVDTIYCLDVNQCTRVSFDIKMANVNPMYIAIYSRLPFGDVYTWKDRHLTDYITPVANTWQTVDMPLTDENLGSVGITASIGGPYGTFSASGFNYPSATLTVTAKTSGVGDVDNGGFIIGSGLGGSVWVVAHGQSGTVGTFTVAGPGITGSTVVSSRAMTYKRTNIYKLNIGMSDGNPGGNVWFNNVKFY